MFNRVLVAGFAVLGLLVLCGQHPVAAVKSEELQTDRRVGDALENIAQTYSEQTKRAENASESQPCEAGDDKRDSDLCAQWKAADAAEKAASWAAFAGWFGGLSFLGVVVAIVVAFHSNWIARDTARRQLRAYMILKDATFQNRGVGEAAVCILRIENTGSTPAYGVRTSHLYKILDASPEIPSFKPVSIVNGSVSDIGPGNNIAVTIKVDESDNIRFWSDISNGEKIIIFSCSVTYDDIYGIRHETVANLFCGGEAGLLPGHGLATTPNGSWST
jgi:hypothetical protein